MDAKAVEERGRQIVKASSEGDPPQTLISLLEPLETWTASEKLLRSSKIGVHVNKLRQHKNADVARLATKLVNKWRNDVKKPGSGGSSPAPAAAKAAAAANGTASPARSGTPKQEPAAAKAKWKGDKEKRSAVADKVDYQLTGNNTRDACIKLMYDGLAFMSEEPSKDVLSIARAVELAAYDQYQPETSNEYKTRLRSLFQNLKNKSNPGLRVNVLAGKIKPERFVVMTHEDMKSDAMRAEEERIQKENMDKAMVAQEEKSISASLICGKCGQKKVSYSQAQTRSADEPMTTFCECQACGNRWKFS